MTTRDWNHDVDGLRYHERAQCRVAVNARNWRNSTICDAGDKNETSGTREEKPGGKSHFLAQFLDGSPRVPRVRHHMVGEVNLLTNMIFHQQNFRDLACYHERAAKSAIRREST